MTQMIGRKVEHVSETVSTMDDVASRAAAGEPEGLVIRADSQTGGRGRYQRQWESAASKDILLSILFRPRSSLVSEVNLLVATSVAETTDKFCGVQTKIKWPNDVRVNGAKVGGLLLESSQSSDGLAVVAGIGLNVNSEMSSRLPDGIEAVSFKDLAEREFDLTEVTKFLLARIDYYYSRVNAGETVLELWKQRLETLGREVAVTFTSASQAEQQLVGIAEDVDETGRLLVRDADGRVWPLAAGEVTMHGSDL